MKKFLLILCISLLTYSGVAQSTYGDISLEQKGDFKGAESSVLKAAAYLFTSKYDKDDLDRLYAIEFIIKWMSGTPDYKFELNEKFSKPFVNETDLMGLYMAGMARYAIQNKSKNPDPSTICLNAIKLVIEYSSKSANNLKQTAEMKKIASAIKKGTLEKYFGI